MPEGNIVGSSGKAQKGTYGSVGKKKKVKVKKPVVLPTVAYQEPVPQPSVVYTGPEKKKKDKHKVDLPPVLYVPPEIFALGKKGLSKLSPGELQAYIEYSKKRVKKDKQAVEFARRKKYYLSKLEKAGFPQGHTGLLARTGEDFAKGGIEFAEQMPGGLVGLGWHAYQDITLAGGKHDRVAKDAVEMAKQMAADFEHPLRRPFYTTADIFAILSLGAGAASRVGAAGEAVRAGEGLRGAVRPFIRKPIPEPIEYAPGVEGQLSVNPILRPIQRRRAARIYKEFTTNAPDSRLIKIPGWSAEDVIGRNVRANRRVETSLYAAPSQEMTQAARGLTESEHTALDVVGIDGDLALVNPVATIERHIARHQEAANNLKAELNTLLEKPTTKAAASYKNFLYDAFKQNEDYIGRLKKAQKVLENPSEKFSTALETARRLVHESEQEQIRRGYLTQEIADGRRAAIAHEYGVPSAAPESEWIPSGGFTNRPGTLAAKAEKATSEENIRMVVSGEKPSGILGTTVSKDVIKQAKDQGLEVWQEKIPDEWGGGKQTYIAKDKAAKNRLKEAQSVQNINEPAGDVLIGRALGYAEADIESYINHNWGTSISDVMRSLSTDLPPEGSFYFPMSRGYTQFFTRARTPGAYSPRLGPGGVPLPNPGVTHEFTGKSVELGGPGKQVGNHIADVLARRAKFYSTEDFYDQLYGYSTAARETPQQIPIRDVRGIPDELKKLQSEAEDSLSMAPEQDAVVMEGLAQRIKDAIFPQDVPIPSLGTEVDGVRWVDARLIKELERIGPIDPIEQLINMVNRPIRFGMVYARPAYIMNKFQNWAMGTVTEGVRYPKLYKMARNAEDIWGKTATSRMDAAMGTTRSASYISKRAKVGKITKEVETFWQRITDQNERRAAFIGQAEREGYIGEEAIGRLLKADDEVLKKDLIRISRTARKNAVDFDSMTPFEQAIATAIFFYPWMTRGSAWAVRATMEHPAKVATLGNLGSEENKHILGGMSVPEWLAGTIPIHIHGETYLINPTSVNTWETAAEVAKDVQGMLQGVWNGGADPNNLADLASPALQLLLAGAGVDQKGQGGLKGMIEGLAPIALLKRLGIVGKPSKTFPHTGFYEALAPFFFGGLAPRHANLSQASKGHSLDEYQQKIEVLTRAGFAPTPEERQSIEEAAKSREEWDGILKDAHRKKADLTDEEIAQMRFELLVKVHPEMEQYRSDAFAAFADPDTVHKADYTTQIQLGWDWLTRLNSAFRKLGNQDGG